MTRACLVDTTRCIGCRACQVACKEWNGLEAEETAPFASHGFVNPPAVSSRTFTIVTFDEVASERASGGLRWVFAKRQCMHCLDPACVAACPVTALRKRSDGPVTYDSDTCIGCRYCVLACPFGVPTAEWDSAAPRIRKCDFCAKRIGWGAALAEVNGEALSADSAERSDRARRLPACAAACPTGALSFGERDDLLADARERIRSAPGRYGTHVYGEKEVGGTSWLYLASVPFDALHFPARLPETSLVTAAAPATKAIPFAVVGVGITVGLAYWIARRREEVAASAAKGPRRDTTPGRGS